MMNLNALKIDPEFQGKIPPLNAEEEHILEQNMIQERRLLNPIIIWNGYILDGHSRYRILKHHPEIAFEVKEIQLPDSYGFVPDRHHAHSERRSEPCYQDRQAHHHGTGSQQDRGAEKSHPCRV